MSDLATYGELPGIGSLLQTTENVIWSGRETDQWFIVQPIYASAVDAGNSPTTTLRSGLVMGARSADGTFTNYSPTATDGSQVATAIFGLGQDMLVYGGSTATKYGWMLTKGILKGANLIGLDGNARRQLLMGGRFIFDDEITGKNGFMGGWQQEIAKTANYTCVNGDSGTLFTNVGATGAVVFTLPAVATAIGVALEFLVVAQQTVTITCPDGAYINWDGALVTNLAFSTASHKTAGHLQLFCNAAQTQWYVRNMGPIGDLITAS